MTDQIDHNTGHAAKGASYSDWYVGATKKLIVVSQHLSHARTLGEIMTIVRSAARDITGADGATFVLRDGEYCFYADEDAIAPLWKGQRFPMSLCVSGWVMTHGQSLVIPDITQDQRIPLPAYSPTFVKSLAMVPIRQDSPIGAIGNYWSKIRTPTSEEVELLEALANLTAVAMENVDLYGELQKKIRALENSNEELNRFAWIASHDLKSPLRAVDNLAAWVEEDAGPTLHENARQHLVTLRQRVRRMERLLDDILAYAQIERKMDLGRSDFVTGAELIDTAVAMVGIPPAFSIHVATETLPDLVPHMPLQLIFTNLISNAVKHHHSKMGSVWIECADQEHVYMFTVRDDGPGIAREHHARIFDMFQTLGPKTNDSNGMGLAFVRKLCDVHGGSIRVESEGPGHGTAFHVTWPKPSYDLSPERKLP